MGNYKITGLALITSAIIVLGLSETTYAQTPTPTSVFSGGGEWFPPTGTPIAPTPTAPNFSSDPDYQSPPTPVPLISLPDVPSLPGPGGVLSTPSLPDNTLPTPGATLAAINTTLTLSHTEPLTISAGSSGPISNTAMGIISSVESSRQVFSDILSNTNAMSATYMSLWNQTDSWAVESAPDWYAPTLPRPVADIGWRFELMGTDVRRRYSLTAWGGMVVEIAALPLRFIKGLRDLGSILGPFGLFITWLLIMTPVVLFFRIIEFIKNLAIGLWNFAVQIAHIVMDLIELIPGE